MDYIVVTDTSFEKTRHLVIRVADPESLTANYVLASTDSGGRAATIAAALNS